MANPRNQKKAKAKAPAKEAPEKKGPQRRLSPGDAPRGDGILDQNTKRDIVGVVFIIAGVVLLLLAILTKNDAVLSGFASMWLHLAFGIGCFILPIVLIAIGVTFLYKFNKHRVQIRAAIGFTIIFIALLGFFALFAPISTLGKDDPGLLFSEHSLTSYGGYIGSAIAYVGIMFLGRLITGVILLGVILIGILIVGFSINKLVEVFKGKRKGSSMYGGNSQSAPASGAFARVRRRDGQEGPADYMDYLEFANSNPGFDPNVTTPIGMPGAGMPVADQYANAAFDQYDLPEQDEYPIPSSYEEDMFVPLPNLQGDARTQVLDDPVASRLSYDDESIPPNATRKLGAHSQNPREQRRIPLIDDENPSMTRPLRKRASHEEDDHTDASEEKVTSNPRKAKAAKTQKASKAAKAAGSMPTPQDGFKLPSMALLNKSGRTRKDSKAKASLDATAQRLHDVLNDFGIDANVVDWIAGPTVTLFEVDLPAGVRVSRITALTDDIALALAAPGVRIFAPVPGTNYVGIEVPNTERESVFLSDVLQDAPEGPLQIAIGKDVEGNSIVSDLAKMPHLLIGGTTGSGKSVAINAMIMSILMRATPSEVRFIMIDPKRVEFTPYNGIPHLYVPVVTEPKEAASALAWGVAEMERRLKIFSKIGARNISQYNAKVHELKAEQEANGEADAETSEEALEDGQMKSSFKQAQEDPLEEMPYIVIIIDELADLMMNIGKEVELSISRIAQLARAAGIHLIVATQRPSTNVVTGLIKANITNRIAFNVASGIDSRVILDTPGAESLIGLGDLLLSKPELAKPQRIQGCFVSEDEINKVVDVIREQGSPEYHSEILQTTVYSQGNTDPNGSGPGGDLDPLVWEAAEITVSSKMGSTSNIQRRLKVGYARAGRIMDQLEELGVVGPANGSKPREVLVDELELESLKAFEQND